MEKSNKRGKIPQADWPLIMARYEAGETLASIARTYDCSPPAISYVVSKSRARQPSLNRSAAGPSGSEAQLIKSMAGERVNSGSAERLHLDAPSAPGLPPEHISPQGSTERRAEIMSPGSDITAASAIPQPGNGHSHRNSRDMARDMDGFPRDGSAERGLSPSRAPAPTQTHPQAAGGAGNGPQALARAAPPPRSGADMRHRLHLSLGNGPFGNGPLGSGASSHDGSGDTLFPSSARSVADESRSAPGHNGEGHAAAQGHTAQGHTAQGHTAQGHPRAPTARPPSVTAEFSEAASGPDPMLGQNTREAGPGAATRGKEGAGAFIDQQLRDRVDTDIAAFLAAFDAALIQDTQENRSALREATDRLLRAGARTRIELERLEARVPLSAHERGGGDPGSWHYR